MLNPKETKPTPFALQRRKLLIIAAQGTALAATASILAPLGLFAEGQHAPLVYPINWGNKTRPEITLTFDDGPIRSIDQRMLKVLRDFSIKAFFFIPINYFNKNPDFWVEAVEKEGHSIANHTLDHIKLDKRFLTLKEIAQQITGWEQPIANTLGTEYLKNFKENNPFIRLPGGVGSNDLDVLQIIADLGYIPIGGSTETYNVIKNSLDKPPQEVAPQATSYIVNHLDKGAIVLLHLSIWDDPVLIPVINAVKAKDLSIVSLPHLLDMEKEMIPIPHFSQRLKNYAI